MCCTSDQVSALQQNLARAEPLILSCPACRNNFRSFFCAFTCSPNQSQFLDVSATQKTDSGQTAVKSVEYWVGEEYRQGFYDSCKDVKFGASNGFVMDLLGGGARDPDAFLKYMGDERPLVGSPFQINFPHLPTPPDGGEQQPVGGDSVDTWTLRNGTATKPSPIPFSPPTRACSDEDLLSKCACTDCPDVCAVLPHVNAPSRGNTCQVGAISCFSFALILVYALGLLAFTIGYGTSKKLARRRRLGLRHRSASGLSTASESSVGYERVRLSSDDNAEGANGRRANSGDSSSAAASPGLIGATGLGHYDGEDSASLPASGLGRGTGANAALDALGTPQPRSYALNVFLQRFFYRMGLACARAPAATFAIACVLLALANIGWKDFAVETDPVRLWVAPQSESKLRKEYFDEHFGPFYRTQQIFVTDTSGAAFARDRGRDGDQGALEHIDAALDWERLQWWSQVEEAVRNLRSGPNGYSLEDVCFAPAGPGTPCVVQSIMGYFGNDLEGSVDESTWRDRLDGCADSPAECLPDFGQPLKRNIVLGGIPEIIRETVPGGGESGGQVRERAGRASDARAVVVTYVVNNSLDSAEVAKAEEWEAALEKLLFSIAGVGHEVEHELGAKRRELGLEMAFSTGLSLEQEIGSSSNTDVGIVILSYVLMFLYAALTLGGGSSAGDAPSGVLPSAPHGALMRTGLAGRILSFLPGGRQVHPAHSRPARRFRLSGLTRRLFIDSKFTLGLFGIIIVLASVSSAVGFFSFMGVKVTLIIAEVIPFLVLAVGVDNIFILCNELDRQNALASTTNPYASASVSRSTFPRPGRAALGTDEEGVGYEEDADSLDGDDLGSTFTGPTYYLPAEERVARSLARMGPSILLSATTQVTAFLLGALVPMPAVRNFALYAAGSMAIAAVLQCTVFASAMALDARRTEASRVDCLPCLRVAPPAGAEYTAMGVGAGGEGVIAQFIRRYYAPTLVRPNVKRGVLAAFAGLLVLSLIGAHRVEMGLDQRLALPAGSYLRDYFNNLDTYLDVGPPVYFVVRHVDTTARPGQQALCGRFTTCEPLSLANTLEGERRRPAASFLAEPASSWIDDFLQWLNPVLENCCRVRIKDPNTFCSPRDSEFDCQPCFLNRQPAWNITMNGLPEDEEFMMYLHQWLRSPTNEDCPLGGQAAYGAALSIQPVTQASTLRPSIEAGEGIITELLKVDQSTGERVEASHFRTYHTPLRSQADFIDSLAAVERIAEDVKVRTGADVFPYSIHYVFFDQYARLGSITAQVLGGAALAVMAIATALLGSWRTGATVLACVASALLGVVGMMGVWGIGFNALTLVNLSVCTAISVEFCAHVARAYMNAPGSLPRQHPMAQKERDERAWAALVDVGSSVSLEKRLRLVLGGERITNAHSQLHSVAGSLRNHGHKARRYFSALVHQVGTVRLSLYTLAFRNQEY